MRAILGGTFDPVHLGHLHAALVGGALVGASSVTLLLAARPWHRSPPRANVEHRWAMLRLAALDANAGRLPPHIGAPASSSRPVLEASERELVRPGPSYTVATLAEMADERPLVWFLGADALASIHTWHRVEELPALCHLLVFNRPGETDHAQGLPCGFTRLANAAELRCRPSGGIHHVAAEMTPISATTVRRRVLAGADAAALLSPRVWAYIRERALYAKPDHPSAAQGRGQTGTEGGVQSKREN